MDGLIAANASTPENQTGGSKERAVEYLRRCLGPVAPVLADPAVTDVNLNADGWVWVTREGVDAVREFQMPAHKAEALIAAVASTLDQVATRRSPVVEGKLITDGSRFEGMMPPFVPSPSFSIRRPPSRVFPLSDYVERGIMTEAQLDLIERAVRDRMNIVVTGGTGSGKTTLLNAIIDAIARLTPDHRVVGIEDTPELRCAVENSLLMLASEDVPLDRALRVALRCFPDRIIVGEVRGPEALNMLMAWNTGHPGGVCSIHSNTTTPGAALTRLEGMVGYATAAPQHALIAEAVDLIICVERTKDANGRTTRRVSQIVSVTGWNGTGYQLKVEG